MITTPAVHSHGYTNQHERPTGENSEVEGGFIAVRRGICDNSDIVVPRHDQLVATNANIRALCCFDGTLIFV